MTPRNLKNRLNLLLLSQCGHPTAFQIQGFLAPAALSLFFFFLLTLEHMAFYDFPINYDVLSLTGFLALSMCIWAYYKYRKDLNIMNVLDAAEFPYLYAACHGKILTQCDRKNIHDSNQTLNSAIKDCLLSIIAQRWNKRRKYEKYIHDLTLLIFERLKLAYLCIFGFTIGLTYFCAQNIGRPHLFIKTLKHLTIVGWVSWAISSALFRRYVYLNEIEEASIKNHLVQKFTS